MKKTVLLFIAAAAVFELAAEVYLLGPGRRSRGQGDLLGSVLPGFEKVLFKEKITVNSFGTTLEVSAVKGKLEEIVLLLKKLKVSKLNAAGGSVRFERKLGKTGMVERFLLVASREGRPLTCFRMEVPEKLPPPEEWPSELPPLPPGAQITAVTRLGQGGVCGEFKSAQEPPYVLLRRVDALMRNKKMFPASNEISSRSGGTGEIFYDEKSIVWVNFSATGHGAFFYRKRSSR